MNFVSAVLYIPRIDFVAMSDDDSHEPIYIIQLPDSDFLTPQANKTLYRKIRANFISMLDDIPGGFRINNCGCCGTEAISTRTTSVEIMMYDDRNVFYEFYNNIDMPRSSWKTGQLAFYVIKAIEKQFHPASVVFLLPNNRAVIDLVVAKVEASIGDKSTTDTIGAIPLHYRNKIEIAESKELIKDFQEDVLNDFAFKEGKDGINEIKFTTKIAYAWHNRHGTLSGFNPGKRPAGLDAKVLHSGVAMVPR